MTRGEEETSTSRAGRKRGPARGTRSASSIVSSLTMEELRTYYEIPDNVNLKLMEKLDKSTMGGEHNAVFFTREQLAVRLRFSVPALVKQFLHFTQAPLTLIHPNIIRILTGCSMLNFLYQLDLSLVEICFIYALKVGQGGRLSMSVRNARLQLINGLPDLPKTEAKGALLVRGLRMRPWVSLSFLLGFGHNHFQVCTSNGFGLLMCMCVSFYM